MRYAVRNLVSFNAMESCDFNLLRFTLEHMRARIRDAGANADDADTFIRPYPCEVGESSGSGYDKLKPRWAIEVTMATRDRAPRLHIPSNI